MSKAADMDELEPELPLNQISTLWTVVSQARGSSSPVVEDAQRKLIERYGRAIHRYLLGALRDPEAADELFQEFALRCVRGDLSGVDRGRGRFRDFIKGALFHLIADHHRRRRRIQSIPDGAPEPEAPAADIHQQERDFLQNWREELLKRAWGALADIERRTGKAFHSALHLRANHPQLRSAEMAEQLSAQLGRAISAAGLRQTLHRARERFVDLLVVEVVHSLSEPTAEKLEQELIDLGLSGYCQQALARYRGGAASRP
jgi:RNA polymerase sigma-70 factor (ECF subfamily)